MTWILGTLGALLVGLAAFVAVDRLTDDRLTDDSGAAAPGGGSVPTVQAPSTDTAGTNAVTTVLTESASESSAAGPAVLALRAAADADAATVEALVGQWVPQVSQRRVGPGTGGLAMKAAEIAALHAALQQSVGAVLLNSSDYVFRADNMWVSIVPEGFASADAALDRCESLPVTDQPCVARFITHDESVAATVKQRKP